MNEYEIRNRYRTQKFQLAHFTKFGFFGITFAAKLIGPNNFTASTTGSLIVISKKKYCKIVKSLLLTQTFCVLGGFSSHTSVHINLHYENRMHTTNSHESSFPSSSKYTQEFDLAEDVDDRIRWHSVIELGALQDRHPSLTTADQVRKVRI